MTTAETMSTSPLRAPNPRERQVRSDVQPPRPALLSLGCAVPALRWDQQRIADELADLWDLRSAPRAGEQERWRRIIAHSGVESRHAVLPPRDVVKLSTAERMSAYARLAPPLAHAAALQAILRASIPPARITDLIIVTCTGFAAPGVDAALIQSLGLSPTTRRLTVGFMGCFGAITGLRAAAGACAADPDAVALVVCVELCSLHFRADPDPQNMVACALFADGAAAAVVAGERALVELARAPAPQADPIGGRPVRGVAPRPAARITPGASLLIPEGAEWMTWTITDSGFAMTLTRQVPLALRERLHPFVSAGAATPPRTFIVHPGGPGILDAAQQSLGPAAAPGVAISRSVLARRGNMSSATVLFVLDQAMRAASAPITPAMLLAFGPGLTIESLTLMPA